MVLIERPKLLVFYEWPTARLEIEQFQSDHSGDIWGRVTDCRIGALISVFDLEGEILVRA